ncbi:MAG: class II glutamine amidotransferase [Solirubrobacteraceae bacterium]
MCRLFGLTAGSEPVTAKFWLLDAPDSLREQSHREPDGTGLGWFGDGQPRVDKQPLAAFEDREFARAARTARSPAFVGHVRFASTGALTLQNTHPFEQAGRLFAHNGVLEGLPELEARLGVAMSLVQGDTDSERWFALITTEIERRDGDVEAGIVAALEWVAVSLPVLSLNFVMITASGLWALRYPDTHELHVLERPAGGTGPVDDPLDHRSSLGTRLHSEEAADRPTVVVATEVMDDDPAWRALATGELIHVDRSLKVTSRIVLETAPAHPLTLEQLNTQARQSQT